MMTHRSELGKLGENITCQYLINKGYKIIDKNFSSNFGEIDIIAFDCEKTLVFVEVKTVKQMSQNIDKQIFAEDQLTKSKLEKLKRMALFYSGNHQNLIDEERGWRIDLIALTIQENSYLINHYKNIDL